MAEVLNDEPLFKEKRLGKIRASFLLLINRDSCDSGRNNCPTLYNIIKILISMSEFVKLTYGSTDGLIRPESLQETGRPSSMTMQGLSPNVQYYTQAELYDGLQLVSQSLQETFTTLRAGTITLTHVSDTRSGNDYNITYSVSNTYALSSSIMTINNTNIQGVISGSTITFTVSGLGDETTYTYSISTIDIYGETETTSGSLTTGEHDYAYDYFTIKNETNSANPINFYTDNIFYAQTIYYSLNNGSTWSSVYTDQLRTVTIPANGSMLLKHTGALGTQTTSQGLMHTSIYSISGAFSISGNIASLCYGDNFTGSKSMPQYAYYGLFQMPNGGNNSLVSAQNLYLGAYTTVSYYGFYNLFSGCSSLTDCPQMGHFTGGSGFGAMFRGCAITTPPDLSHLHGTLDFQRMFQNCTSLTTVPDFSNLTSTDDAYFKDTFNGCTSLTKPINIGGINTLGARALYGTFNGCTNLTEGIDLRNVTTIANDCLYNTYYNCTSLNVAYAPTVTWNTSKSADWLYGVANSGTLFADPTTAASIPTNSASGCPSGWSLGAVSDEFFKYFTIKNESENTNTISLWAESYLAERDVDISVDGGTTWTAYTALRNPGQPVAQLSAGGEMLARYVGTIGDPHYISFRSSDKISAHGNVASLQFGDNFKKINQTISSTQFNGLFIGSEYLIDASKLSFESYTATQGLGLYRTFEMCTSLIDPPDFSRITSVNNNRSFFQTFYGCSSLAKVYAPSPSVWNSGNTYQNWLYGVAASGTIYANPTTAASIPTDSTSGCPTGWSISTT